MKKHPLQEEHEKLTKLGLDLPAFADIVSSHQLIIKGSWGTISVVRGGLSFGHFEIYCLEGDLFDDTKRYKTVEQAGKTIYKLLTEGMFDESVARQWDVWNDIVDPPQTDGAIQDVDMDD